MQEITPLSREIMERIGLQIPIDEYLKEERDVIDAALCLMLMKYEGDETAKLEAQCQQEKKMQKIQKRNFEKGEPSSRIVDSRTKGKGKGKRVLDLPGSDNLFLSRFPPVEFLNGKIGTCSIPFKKQLTKSDLDSGQNRLILSSADVKRYLIPLLNANENLNNKIPVVVYDMDGKSYEMIFKIWHGKIHVLIGGWSTFANDHGFEAGVDHVIVWMFRHSETEKLCFVLGSERLQNKRMKME